MLATDRHGEPLAGRSGISNDDYGGLAIGKAAMHVADRFRECLAGAIGGLSTGVPFFHGQLAGQQVRRISGITISRKQKPPRFWASPRKR